MRFLAECLLDCLDTAAAKGVTLALEPLNCYETDLIHTVEEGLELIQQVGSRQARLAAGYISHEYRGSGDREEH